MVNSEAFVRRLEKILEYYGLSASAFADKVGVQRSSISHLLTGRNKPSLEFVLKVINTFPEINLYWLLNGKGSFPTPVTKKEVSADEPRKNVKGIARSTVKEIDKIIVFYSDGTFETFSKSF